MRYSRKLLSSVVWMISLAAPSWGDLEPKSMVTVQYHNGSTVSGVVRYVGVEFIEILPLSGPPYRIKAVNIAAIRSGERSFLYDSESKRWITGTPAPVPKSPLLATKNTPTRKTPTGQSTEALEKMGQVTVEGVGATPEEASRDAIREAVRKVAGVLVVAETTVVNDQLIKDKILTLSDGVIVPGSYKELSRIRDGEVWRVKITTQVLTRKLADRLAEVGFKVNEVNVQGLAAAVQSRAQIRKEAAELLAEVLGEMHQTLTPTIRNPDPRDYADESKELHVDVVVGVDKIRYLALERRLLTVLERACVGMVDMAFQVKMTREGYSIYDRKFEMLQAAKSNDRSWSIWVYKGLSGNLVTWRAYQLDCSQEVALAPMRKSLALYLSMTDSEGKPLRRNRVRLALNQEEEKVRWFLASKRTMRHSDSLSNNAANHFLGPLMVRPSRSGGYVLRDTQPLSVKIPLDQEELARLKKIECKVVLDREADE